jgi:polar amino acid transport system substrate-binding protein
MQARSAKWLLVALVSFMVGGCATDRTMPTPEEKQALAPTGKLRLGFLANNAVHATKDPASGELKGPAIDLGKELARRLGVPFEPVSYKTVTEMVGSVSKNEWDVISIGINPDRLKTMDFSAPYSQIEIGILVGKNSPVASIAELDRPGVRIAVLERGDSDILLTPKLKQATLIRTQTIGASVEMVSSGRADATSALKTFLIPASEQVPGSRILDGRITVQDIAIGVPKGKDVSARYVAKFVDDLKASVFVKASIERSAVRGLMVAP